ncbi:MAG: hypothetical protein GY950_23290, partial [bacterium]|nr:hypothetical protein [bacterium]
MKLFKNNRFLQKFFFIELVLIVSGISSFIILAYVKTNPGLTQPDPGSVTGKHQFLFKNYGILAYFLALPNTLFNS